MLANRQIQDKVELSTSFIDVCFKVVGTSFPADNGYGLYSALLRHCPSLRENDSINIQTIAGQPDGKGKITLQEYSCLRIRLPSNADSLPAILPLAGQTLRVGNHEIKLGFPQVLPLKPASSLQARLVTIKGYTEPEPFLDAVDRQIQVLGIHALVGIPANELGEPKRLTIKIKRYSVVGFSVVVRELSPEDSLLLQVRGLGGKRRMGCGVFVPNSGLGY
ncbi:MAG: type I-MYXAN CRISPR-associated protein Cas6/Cmx6 [Cyanobacteria bacterium P01_D01_bin.14]